MNFVEPIRSKEKIAEIKNELRRNGSRDYMLFELGINSGPRISDLRNLKVSDILNQDRTPKEHLEFIEEKTNKTKKFKINPSIQKELVDYCRNMELTEYLFKSRKGQNKPITRVQAYRIIRNAGERVGINNLGSHTIRKTFGYWFYKETKDIVLLQKLFNHSNPSITLHYIGIEQDEIDNAYESFRL